MDAGFGVWVCSSAVSADLLRIWGVSAAVVDEEAAGAGEFVELSGGDGDGGSFAGQVGAGPLEGHCGVDDVHRKRCIDPCGRRRDRAPTCA